MTLHHHHRPSGRDFYLTPMLDRGWGYDPYVMNLIGRIKADRPALPCLFDSNSFYLGSGKDSDQQRTAFKGRVITDQEIAEYRAEADKRRAANEEWMAQQHADRLAREAEKRRVEEEWQATRAEIKRRHEDRIREWEAAHPRVKTNRVAHAAIPLPGWWYEDGDYVVVALKLQAHNATEVLVGREGAAAWIAKFQIKQVKSYADGLHELTIDGDLAKRLGFCEGEPTQWVS